MLLDFRQEFGESHLLVERFMQRRVVRWVTMPAARVVNSKHPPIVLDICERKGVGVTICVYLNEAAHEQGDAQLDYCSARRDD